MPVLPNGQMLPYAMGGQPGLQQGMPGGILSGNPNMAALFGGGQGLQGSRFSQNTPGVPGASTGGAGSQPQTPQQVDPRLQMWIQQQMQRRQSGDIPSFTRPMTVQDRIGSLTPGLATLRSGGAGFSGPSRQGIAGMQQGMSSGMLPQNLQGAQTGPQDLVTNRRRGILGGLA